MPVRNSSTAAKKVVTEAVWRLRRRLFENSDGIDNERGDKKTEAKMKAVTEAATRAATEMATEVATGRQRWRR